MNINSCENCNHCELKVWSQIRHNPYWDTVNEYSFTTPVEVNEYSGICKNSSCIHFNKLVIHSTKNIDLVKGNCSCCDLKHYHDL